MTKILIADRDKDLTAKLEKWLVAEMYTVEVANDGYEASRRLQMYSYDLILLDWHITDPSGIDICRRFRSHGGLTPILVLTDRSSDGERATATDAGGDDYIAEPFSLVEISARLRALLRRLPSSPSAVFRMGELIMDLQKHSVTRLGSTIQLDPKEFALLEFFLRHPNEVFSIDVLRQKVWRSERIGVNAVRTCINRLREKIDMGCQHSIIETVHRVGYRLCGTETDME